MILRITTVCIFSRYLLPYKTLWEEGQATKNLLTLVELLHIRRSYHGDAMVVHDAVVVHTQAITHCKTNHDNSFYPSYLNQEIKLNSINMSSLSGKE